MKRFFAPLCLSLALSFVAVAHADTVVLNFEGIVPADQPYTYVNDYYNGGGGGNLGITFSSNALALCLVDSGNACSNNTSRGGLGNPSSAQGGLFFLDGDSTFMNSASGFTTGFSLYYSAVNEAGALSVYSGLNGTGTLLATLTLPTTGNGAGTAGCYGTSFCPFTPVGVTFSGTAESISFAGVANQIVFDDVTFGSAVAGQTSAPSATPEPSSLVLLGTGLAGFAGVARRRFKRTA